MKRIAIPCLILLFSFCSNSGYGQIKAVLVKLYSEENRINHFESRGDKTNADHVREDAKKIMQVTINDFEGNFHYCNVYYFIDTNISKILASDFTGVLLDEHLQPATNTVLKNGDTSFLIAYYGIPDDVLEDKRDGVIYKSGFYPNDGLVVVGHNNKRMRWIDHFYYHPPVIFRRKNSSEYFSRRFGMGYRAFADLLQKELTGYRGTKEQKSAR